MRAAGNKQNLVQRLISLFVMLVSAADGRRFESSSSDPRTFSAGDQRHWRRRVREETALYSIKHRSQHNLPFGSRHVMVRTLDWWE